MLIQVIRALSESASTDSCRSCSVQLNLILSNWFLFLWKAAYSLVNDARTTDQNLKKGKKKWDRFGLREIRQSGLHFKKNKASYY